MKNIIITGGGFHNKGAQAMTFTVVDEIKKRYKNSNVIMLSTRDFLRDENEKEQYMIEILPWTPQIKLDLAGGIFKPLSKLLVKNKKHLITKNYKNEIEYKLKDADMIIDISGFALSSQFPWTHSLDYMLNIIIAKKYNKKMYLLPQSFGPFNYRKHHKILINSLIKKYLTYPSKIFARENQGYEYLKQYTSKNLNKSCDIVLQKNEVDKDNIYSSKEVEKVKSQNVNILENSIGIIPNIKALKYGNEEHMYKIYKKHIDTLLSHGKVIYLLRHSYEDLNVCREIKNMFPHEDNVILIESDFNCIQINDIFKKFDFIIASRYHSIVHAYKNGVPAIIFGWSVKYKELSAKFNQEEYLFDTSELQDENKIMNSIELMIENYNQESKVIAEIIKEVQHQSIFNEIFI